MLAGTEMYARAHKKMMQGRKRDGLYQQLRCHLDWDVDGFGEKRGSPRVTVMDALSSPPSLPPSVHTSQQLDYALSLLSLSTSDEEKFVALTILPRIIDPSDKYS